MEDLFVYVVNFLRSLSDCAQEFNPKPMFSHCSVLKVTFVFVIGMFHYFNHVSDWNTILHIFAIREVYLFNQNDLKANANYNLEDCLQIFQYFPSAFQLGAFWSSLVNSSQ